MVEEVDQPLTEQLRRVLIEIERLDHESSQLTMEAKGLDQITIRLQAWAALLQARAIALRRLANKLRETAPQIEAHLISEGENVPPEGS